MNMYSNLTETNGTIEFQKYPFILLSNASLAGETRIKPGLYESSKVYELYNPKIMIIESKPQKVNDDDNVTNSEEFQISDITTFMNYANPNLSEENLIYVVDTKTLDQDNTYLQYKQISNKIEKLFISVNIEELEDGNTGCFTDNLSNLIMKYPMAMSCISQLILNQKINQSVAAETLKHLGYLKHESSYQERLTLLEKALSCSDEDYRDGANLGIASMDDPHAIPFLRKAINKESSILNIKFFSQTLKQLEDTAKCRSFYVA